MVGVHRRRRRRAAAGYRRRVDRALLPDAQARRQARRARPQALRRPLHTLRLLLVRRSTH